jgi:N-acetylmuramoyl-L-alanine amidase
MAYKIMIDPGHGGKDPGAIGPSGLKEKDVNLDIAKRLGEILKVNGITVNYTRTTDIFVDLGDRAAIANRWGANYFVSVHCNAFTDRQAHGTETYCYDFGGEGEKLARKVQASLVKATGLRNRADVKKAGFTVLKKTAMPAILVETAFISNPNEEKKLANSAFRQTVANGIASGICEYLGIKRINNNGGDIVETIVTYLGDVDALAAIVVGQKYKAPVMRKADFESSGISAKKVIQIGGTGDRFDTFKRAAQLL